jgi:hypothetical protein
VATRFAGELLKRVAELAEQQDVLVNRERQEAVPVLRADSGGMADRGVTHGRNSDIQWDSLSTSALNTIATL